MIKILLGLPLLAFAIRRTEIVESTRAPFAQNPDLGEWVLELLPDWSLFGWHFMRPYANLWDGVRGDKRGWYAKEYGQSTFWRWWWCAVRNPTNFNGRVINAIDISQYKTAVVPGYKEYVDEDSAEWGESKISATHTATGEVVHAYVKMKKLPFGYYALWKSGYKFSLGEEYIDFGPLPLYRTYESIKSLCIQYALSGYRTQGDAEKALDRLAPATNRGFIPTIKKIKS